MVNILDEFGLRLGQRRSKCPDPLTAALHGCPPPQGDQS